MGCSHISIDVMDVSGDYHLHVDDHEILKQRIDLDGNRIRVNPRKSKVSQPCIKCSLKVCLSDPLVSLSYDDDGGAFRWVPK